MDEQWWDQVVSPALERWDAAVKGDSNDAEYEAGCELAELLREARDSALMDDTPFEV